LTLRRLVPVALTGLDRAHQDQGADPIGSARRVEDGEQAAPDDAYFSAGEEVGGQGGAGEAVYGVEQQKQLADVPV
jgi:hypothetical protein